MVNRKIIFWVAAILVLTLYNLTPALNSFDTEYYILAGQNFLDGKIDCLRTPIYPLLCQAFIKLFEIEGLPTAMTIFQSLIYLISLVSLQHIANYTIKNKTMMKQMYSKNMGIITIQRSKRMSYFV